MEKQAEFEIDLQELFYYLRKRVGVIISVTLVCGLIGFIVGTFVIRPQFTASTRVFILNRTDESSVLYSDFQVSNYMLNDYRMLISGQNVTREVISQLQLDMTDAELAGNIVVTTETNTRILQIDVTNADPQMAADIANCVREVASRQIQDIMDLDAVKTVYEAEVPTAPSAPNIQRNITLSAGAGLLVSAGILVIMFILDDTIRTEEDVERYLGLSTLGIIPESEELDTSGRKGMAGRKHDAQNHRKTRK